MTEGGEDWTELGYISRFAARRSVTWHMIAAGWTFDAAQYYLRGDRKRPEIPGWDLWGSDRRHVSEDEKYQRFWKDWRQVQPHAESHVKSRPDVLAVCGELRDRTETWSWRPRTGRYDKAVVLFAIGKAESSGGFAVRMPEREVAIRARISPQTARRALDDPARTGEWLEPTGKPRLHLEGAQYRLRWQHILSFPVSQTGCPYGGDTEFAPLGNSDRVNEELENLLGKHRTAVLLALAEYPQQQKDLVAKTGVSKGTVSKAMKQFTREGLAEYTGTGWVKGPKDPATYDPGTRIAADRKARIQRERESELEKYRDWLRNHTVRTDSPAQEPVFTLAA